MSQQKQAPLPRQEFQEWLENAAVPVLVLQKGKHLGSVVKVPATPEIDYLFGCETFYGERISWSDRLEFCGLYDRQHQALHLLDDPLPNFVSGLTEEECQDSTAFGKRIAQEVDRYVEAAISNERSRLSVRELTSERNINSYRYYKGTEAGREAASLVFSGEKPDVQFHSEYYTSLTEDTLLSYLKSPEDYIKTTAEQYMRDNQEEFLAQFLKKDALLAEYQMLSQDSDAPVYRMRAITDALQKSGAKTVNVTVGKRGEARVEYRKVYFRIRSRYQFDSGWPAETDAAKFHEESRSLFQSAGWDLQPGGDSTSDTVTKGWQELYCIR